MSIAHVATKKELGEHLNIKKIVIINFWAVAINPDLDEDNRVMVLETTDGQAALADKVGLYQRQDLSESTFLQRLNEAGVTLHGADYVFYFSEADKKVLLQEELEGVLR